MTNLTVTLVQPVGCTALVYTESDVLLSLTLDRSLRITDSYSLFLYTDDLRLMGDARSDDSTIDCRGRHLTLRLSCRNGWMPGRYFLLLRSEGGARLRFDLLLSERGTFRCSEGHRFSPLSDDDILSGRILRRKAMWQRLSDTPGAGAMKRWVIERCRLNELNAMQSPSTDDLLSLPGNLTIATRSPQAMCRCVLLLKHVAELESELNTVDCATLCDPTLSAPYERLNELIPSRPEVTNPLDVILSPRKPQMLVYYNIGALTMGNGRQVVERMMRDWWKSETYVVLIGTPQELSALMEQMPSLGQRFPVGNHLSEEDYTLPELQRTFVQRIGYHHLCLTPETTTRLCLMLREAFDRGIMTHWRDDDIDHYITTELLSSHLCHAIALVQRGEETERRHLLLPDDIDPSRLLSRSTASDTALQELNAMVGLSELKRSILTLHHRMTFCARRRALGLPTADTPAPHALFTGNPGTGKTTVARLLGKIYHSMGLLSRGEVVVADRSRIVGRYIGDTEDNMRQLLREAQGNVLFIDEAYTLYAAEGSNDFGRHAMECLLDVLTRRDADMVVVLAGYEREMDLLLTMNPGLRGRFPYRFRFPDYSADELFEIARSLLSRDHYRLTPAAQVTLRRGIGEAVAKSTPHFANARWVEQLLQGGIVPAMADRLARLSHPARREDYQTVSEADVRQALSLDTLRDKAQSPRPTIGFCA